MTTDACKRYWVREDYLWEDEHVSSREQLQVVLATDYDALQQQLVKAISERQWAEGVIADLQIKLAQAEDYIKRLTLCGHDHTTAYWEERAEHAEAELACARRWISDLEDFVATDRGTEQLEYHRKERFSAEPKP